MEKKSHSSIAAAPHCSGSGSRETGGTGFVMLDRMRLSSVMIGFTGKVAGNTFGFTLAAGGGAGGAAAVAVAAAAGADAGAEGLDFFFALPDCGVVVVLGVADLALPLDLPLGVVLPLLLAEVLVLLLLLDLVFVLAGVEEARALPGVLDLVDADDGGSDRGDDFDTDDAAGCLTGVLLVVAVAVAVFDFL